MHNGINIDFTAAYKSCVFRLERAWLYLHLAQSMTAFEEKFNDFKTPFEEKWLTRVPAGIPITDSALQEFRNEFIKWNALEAFNYIIAALLIFIDEVYSVHEIQKNCEGKHLPITYSKQKYDDLEKLLKSINDDCRSTTRLLQKLNALSDWQVLPSYSRDPLLKLYNTRNAIEHWDGYVNSVSFKGINDIFKLDFPIYKVYVVNIETREKNELPLSGIVEPGYSVELGIEFEERTLHLGDKIEFSYNDIASLSLWASTVVTHVYEKAARQKFNKAENV